MTATARLRSEVPNVPFTLRLKAWWKGYDVVVRPKSPARAATAPARPVIGRLDPDMPWRTHAVILSELLWGEGFSLPGGAEEALRLAKPFALDPAMTVVDLNAGLGGGVRAVVEAFGVWVGGYDPSGELATAGMQLSALAGLGKQAAVACYRPEALELRPGSIDCVMARELLHRVDDKERFLNTVHDGLKPNGQVVLTDYVLATPESGESQAVRSWAGSVGEPVTPCTQEEYARLLGAAKLEARVTEDITADHRRMVLAGWADLTAALAGSSIDPEFARCLVTELERWMRLVAALDSGHLKAVRIYALKAGTKMLSDW